MIFLFTNLKRLQELEAELKKQYELIENLHNNILLLKSPPKYKIGDKKNGLICTNISQRFSTKMTRINPFNLYYCYEFIDVKTGIKQWEYDERLVN